MNNKKLKGYATLKEARTAAREKASQHYYSNVLPTPIYLESDGSYSVDKPNDKKAKFVMAIDKAGARYTKVWVDWYGKKREIYKKIKG